MELRQIKAIEKSNKEKLLKLFPTLTEDSGIYILTRFENDFKYAYVGQAKHILTRLAQHMRGFQHIDMSIKKHGWQSEINPNGWSVLKIKCEEWELDEKEQFYIQECARAGYQLKNKTTGGQGEGKTIIAEIKPSKGYYDGLERGYENARRDVAKWFKKYLFVSYEDPDVQNGDKEPRINEKKAMDNFMQFLKGKEDEEHLAN